MHSTKGVVYSLQSVGFIETGQEMTLTLRFILELKQNSHSGSSSVFRRLRFKRDLQELCHVDKGNPELGEAAGGDREGGQAVQSEEG